jgi:hypothetical protein
MGSPTETITVTNMAPDRFARLEAAVSAKHLAMTGSNGEMHDFGADVKFNYNAATQTLVLTVLHGPHFKDFDAFCAELKSWVEAQQ